MPLSDKNHLLPVILSGGAGTRLWPVSREGHPKPFMKLANGKSLLEMTYIRALNLDQIIQVDEKKQILTVTNRDYYFMSRDVLESTGTNGSFLLEPFGKNTAPAIGLAAHKAIALYGSETILLVLAADHLIEDLTEFSKAVDKAEELALQNYIVAFGIIPTFPNTGFGYIECGINIGGGHLVKRFVEKPDPKTAQEFVDSSGYLWNSGMFCFKATTYLDELTKYAPKVASSVLECWNEMIISDDVSALFGEIPSKFFESCPDISVDYAVMEQSKSVAVVKGDFAWNDIGSWSAVRDLVLPNAEQNRALGEVIFVDSANTFVQSEDRLVAMVGVNNLMVIDTTDALLIADADRSQDVKKVVMQLKKDGHETAKLHRTVSRPWGTYTVLEVGLNFKIKRIEVKSGASLSLQMHHHRSEHWIVVQGTAKVINGDQELVVQTNQSTYIPAGRKHRLENQTNEALVMIEVQSGNYLGEDDIVRFNDIYGRV